MPETLHSLYQSLCTMTFDSIWSINQMKLLPSLTETAAFAGHGLRNRYGWVPPLPSTTDSRPSFSTTNRPHRQARCPGRTKVAYPKQGLLSLLFLAISPWVPILCTPINLWQRDVDGLVSALIDQWSILPVSPSLRDCMRACAAMSLD